MTIADEYSLAKIEESDLTLFANAALEKLEEIFQRAPIAGLYRDRLLMLALAQGGALHFLDQKNGLKDIDVWAFFRGGLEKPFPPRSVWEKDLGPSKFGANPKDVGFVGRRIDIMGRSVEFRREDDLISPTMRWLRTNRGSAQHLRKKAVVCIYPPSVRGRVLIKPKY